MQQPITLLDLLRRFRLRSSSDDRDKVYSFLGLVNSGGQFPVTVNYLFSTSRAYLHATTQIIRSTRSLLVLAGTLHGVPEFETERLNRLNLYDAAKGAPAHAILHFPSSLLEILGYIVGVVCHDFGIVPETTARQRATVDQWIYGWREDGGFGYQPNSAFWRTLCGDALYTPTGVPDSVGLPRVSYRRAEENNDEAFRAWRDDRKTKSNRKTSMFGDLMVNSYEEPEGVVERKNAFQYSAQSSSVSRKMFAYKKPDRANLDALLRRENRDKILADRARPCSMGVGPEDLRVGDYVCIAFGSKVPFIIRRSEQHLCARAALTVLVSADNSPREQRLCSSRHDTFHLVGDAYVHELMDGQAMSAGFELTLIFLR